MLVSCCLPRFGAAAPADATRSRPHRVGPGWTTGTRLFAGRETGTAWTCLSQMDDNNNNTTERESQCAGRISPHLAPNTERQTEEMYHVCLWAHCISNMEGNVNVTKHLVSAEIKVSPPYDKQTLKCKNTSVNTLGYVSQFNVLLVQLQTQYLTVSRCRFVEIQKQILPEVAGVHCPGVLCSCAN